MRKRPTARPAAEPLELEGSQRERMPFTIYMFALTAFALGLAEFVPIGLSDVMAGSLGRLLDADIAGQHDEVRKRDLLVAISLLVELAADAVEHLDHPGELGWLVDLQGLY